MRVSKQQAAENREKILVAAARLFREKGLADVGMDEIALAAGMTHGSLYSHFESKEKLKLEALRYGHARTLESAKSTTDLRESVLRYLSPQHRDNPGNGCFMAALSVEMPRETQEVRARLTTILKSNLERIGLLIPGRKSKRLEDDALMMISTMMGALVLSRGVADRELSDRLLRVGRERLLEMMDGRDGPVRSLGRKKREA